MRTDVNRLTEQRNAARDKALKQSSGEIESLRDEIVEGKRRGSNVAALVKRRAELKATRDAELNKIQRELSLARRRAKEAQTEADAKDFVEMSTSELEATLHQYAEARRQLKRKVRAVRAVYDQKVLEERIEEAVKHMSPKERKAFKARLERQ